MEITSKKLQFFKIFWGSKPPDPPTSMAPAAHKICTPTFKILAKRLVPTFGFWQIYTPCPLYIISDTLFTSVLGELSSIFEPGKEKVFYLSEHSDWLMACLCFNNIHKKISPFWLVKSSAVFFKTVQKRVNSVQKEETNQAFLIGQWSKKLTDGQSNLLFSNWAHALDGTIHGAIFPWLCDTRAFLLFYHFKIFLCILLTSNHMIFLVQFRINKHW